MSSTTTTTRDFGSCVACGESLIATIEVRITDIHLDEAVGTANVEVIGTRVSHDCRTEATLAIAAPTCDREHADEWVEVDKNTLANLPSGKRVRREWALGAYSGFHYFVHRDDLLDEGDER